MMAIVIKRVSQHIYKPHCMSALTNDRMEVLGAGKGLSGPLVSLG